MSDLEVKYQKLLDYLKGLESVAVAFSGGVDSTFLLAAAKEAFEDAGLDMSKEDPFRVGVIVGSGIGSLQAVEKEYEKIRTKGPGRVNPLLVPMMISNMAAGNISIQLPTICRTKNQACITG